MAAGVMVRRVLLQIGADDGEAAVKLDRIKVKAEELRLMHPELAVRINAAEAQAKMAVLRQELKATSTESAGLGKAWEVTKYSLLGVGVGLGYGIKMAGDFQASMVKLTTSAGESTANLKGDMAGVLKISVDTATSSKELAAGLYMINSAGYHGAEGLKILRAAAQGARAEGASLADVSNAVTSALNSYGFKASDATKITNMLVAMVGQGKMTMQDLASSIHSVLPVAAAAHISFAQVGGAIATMTMQGMSAQQATQDLAHTIGVLQNPNAVAIKEMQQLGLSSNDVATQLGKRGLTGTIDLLSQTVLKNMGPSGTVLLNTFNSSKAAAADAVTMMNALPKSIQAAAKGFLDGTISTKEWSAALKGLSPIARAQAAEFATTAKNANGFNSALRSGLPGTQTYEAAMSKMMGGTVGLNTALMLNGPHMKVFTDNVNAISAAGKTAGKDVNGWAEIQKTFNFQLEKAKYAGEGLATTLGLTLLPAATKVMGWVASFAQGLQHGSIAATGIAAVIGSVLAGIALKKLEDGLKGAVDGVEGLWKGGQKLVGWAGQLAGKMGLLKTATAEATVATEGEAVAQEGANAAFALSPIGLIVIGLAAVTIAFVELWKHSAGFRNFWKAAWHDIVVIAETAFNWVKGHWPLILGILTGPVGIAAALVATHWRSIVHGAEVMYHDVVSFFTRLPGNILHAVGDLGHLLWSAGSDIIHGLLNGITSQFGAIGSIASSIGSSLLGGVKSFLGIASPSKEFHYLGTQITLGLGAGIRESAHQAVAESQRLASQIYAAAAAGEITSAQETQLMGRLSVALHRALTRAAAQQARDTRIMHDIGLILHQGLLQGLEGTPGSVKSAVAKLMGMVKTEMDQGFISYSRATSITDWLQADSTRLQSLATRRQQILATIKVADTYAAKVTSSTEQAYGVISAAQSITPALGVGGIVRQLLGDVAQIRVFRQNIAKLRRMGLNKAYIDQLIQAGPVQGGQVAAELAAGSEGEIRSVNAAEAQIASASVSLGQTAANAMYDSGKMAGKGFLSGLQEQQKAISQLMEQIARDMVRTLRRELGIRSPSEVMREHGRQIGQGLALGISDSQVLVSAAAQRMARSAVPAGHPAAAAAAGRGGVLQLEWVGGSADQALITLLKHHIRIRGGNPAVLGA